MTASITLAAGPLRLVVDPEIGGGISSFDWVDGRTLPVLHSGSSHGPSPLHMASFPLVPFVNRVRGGGFSFRGKQVRLSPNLTGDISPIHGQGWLAPWTVDSANEREANLTFRHPAGEWPWEYESRQRLSLDDRGLSYRLRCGNLSDSPMPCGLGIHPYFPCGPETRLDTRVEYSWTIDEHVLPVDKVPAEGVLSLSNRLVCGQKLDHGFGGWGGHARISDRSWPFAIEFASPTAKFFQLYSPAEGGFVAAEPVTHANTAMNAPEEQWPELGFEVVEPGNEMVLDVRIDVIAVQQSG
ncbi:MAG: aldose 1-epimerase [Sphingomicrobium sp.]